MAKLLSIFGLLLNLPVAIGARSSARLNLMFNQHGYLWTGPRRGPVARGGFLFFVGEKVAFDAKFVNWTATDLVVRFEDLSATEALASSCCATMDLLWKKFQCARVQREAVAGEWLAADGRTNA